MNDTISEKYYVIYADEDGDIYVYELSKDELIEDLNDECSGLKGSEFLQELKEYDPNDWGGNKLIIKGNIVFPTNNNQLVRKVVK